MRPVRRCLYSPDRRDQRQPTGRFPASSAATARWRWSCWIYAKALGLNPVGFSFHVGSQTQKIGDVGSDAGRDGEDLGRGARGGSRA